MRSKLEVNNIIAELSVEGDGQMYEQNKKCGGRNSDIAFVEFKICRAGHGPIGQSTYLLQVQLPHSGVVSTRGSPHSMRLPHHGIHPSIRENDLHPSGKSL